MKTRKAKPTNNRYYIRSVSGGLNGAVSGKPAVPGANVLCNCVGYANGRFNEIINDPEQKGIYKGFKYQLVNNAENFIESAKRQGLKISDTPIEGGVMVWRKGATLSSGDGAGHVAIVEEVYADGTILTSESGWNAWAFKTVRRSNANGRWGQPSGYSFRGCIVNPGVKSPKVAPVPKLKIDGIGGPSTVLAMQRFFGTTADGEISGQNKSAAKYFPALESVKFGGGGSPCIKKLQKWLGVEQSGVLSSSTVKAWQKKIGVDQDGVFGAKSMKAWQTYLNGHDKATYPAAAAKTTSAAKTTKADKGNEYAKKIAAEKYHYVKYSESHTCPICSGRKYDNAYGWNCIGFAFSVWRHGFGLKSKCNCHVIDNAFGTKLLKLSDAAALKQTRERVGIDDIKVIRNGGKAVPKSKWKKGDICIMYSGDEYSHTFYYMGNGKIADARSGSSRENQINIRDYKNYTAKVIIRYIGK